ncbi:MAG: thioredoxin-dependent thiol peroxidase [Candidatus Binatus sp.]
MPTSKKTAAKATKKPATAASKSASVALEGKTAPAFELFDAEGKTVALKVLIGSSNLVLYFYPKDMTPGCTVEACSFRDNSAPIKKLGAKVVGISADSTDSHGKFIAKHELNFPLLADPGNKVCKLYGVYKMKSLYGREFMGIERTTFIIDKTGVVRKVFPKVKVNGHTEEVLEALKEIA